MLSVVKLNVMALNIFSKSTISENLALLVIFVSHGERRVGERERERENEREWEIKTGARERDK